MIAIAAFSALLALQTGAPPPDSVRRDSARSVNISMTNVRRARKDIPLTPELLASAYRDPTARSLVARAREARAVQDSLLQSYEAMSTLRMSVGARLRAIGRDRLIWRLESARKIQWQRGIGAHVEVLGARAVAPVVSSNIMPVRDVSPGPLAIPYYPGRESLWPMGQIGNVMSDDGIWVHPLSKGAEAYYQYATGDSIAYRLQDQRTIRVTEIRLSPREPRWDLVAGSFWFDATTGQLVRAIYRPSVPMDLQMTFGVDADTTALRWLRPLTMTVKSVNVEFGLHEGRWWLPRRQAAEAEAQVTFARVPTMMEQRYDYTSINAVPPLAPIVVDSSMRGMIPDGPDRASVPKVHLDSLARLDSAYRAARGDEVRTDIRAARRELYAKINAEHCAANGGFRTATRWNDSVRVALRVPCDSATLVGSPALSESIFQPGDDPLTEADVQMLERALGMGSQAVFSPTAPTLGYGLDLVRYNRVEGLSVGAELRQQFGEGFTGQLIGRIGVADLHPRGELLFTRSDAWRTIGLGAYERLGVTNDWGSPLGFGASLNALLFGRDDGLYYRSTGIELTGSGQEGSLFSWRVFGEQHRPADVETHFSVPHAINGLRFRDNIVADRADLLGAAARLHASHGLDPEEFRALGDLRVEGATGDFDFARAMLELTLSRGLFGNTQGSLTAAGGTSAGIVPTQRFWYLGGVHTIRGQPLAAAAGDAFWMGRGEIGYAVPVVRPSIFYDVGWAGDRRAWRTPGNPISGAGIGLSILDGMLRLDLAKGLRPNRGVRLDLTVEARF